MQAANPGTLPLARFYVDRSQHKTDAYHLNQVGRNNLIQINYRLRALIWKELSQ